MVVGTLFAFYWLGVDLWKVIDPRLWVIFCDVGQGDMIIIKKRTAEFVVDWGPSPDKAKDCLNKHLGYFDREIEFSVNSHPHSDHIKGIEGVLGQYRLSSLGYSGEKGGKEFEPIWRRLENDKTRLIKITQGMDLKLDDMNMKVLWPTEDIGTISNINLLSVVLLFNYKSFDLFLPGDLEREEELAITDLGLLRNVEVLKVAHHGSKTSSGDEILSQLKPALAVISAGKNNQYGHPDDVVLSRFALLRSRLHRTDKDGEVRVVTDGDKWRVISDR
jgi:competence protein ComEC